MYMIGIHVLITSLLTFLLSSYTIISSPEIEISLERLNRKTVAQILQLKSVSSSNKPSLLSI